MNHLVDMFANVDGAAAAAVADALLAVAARY